MKLTTASHRFVWYFVEIIIIHEICSKKSSGRTNSWNSKGIVSHKSIWSADFKPKALVINQPDTIVKHKSTAGKIVERKVEIPVVTPKRPIHSKC